MTAIWRQVLAITEARPADVQSLQLLLFPPPVLDELLWIAGGIPGVKQEVA